MTTYKVVDADKLDTDLKAVADSIRAKGGTTENLDFPADFVSAVENIETGGEAKEEQEKTVEITKNGTTEVVADEGKTLSKVTANVNVAFEGDIGKPYIDTSKMTNFKDFISANPLLIDEIDKLDTSNGTNFSNMFLDCSNLTSVPHFDTSKGTSFGSMFENCIKLTSVPHFDTSNGTSFSSMFYSCQALTSVPHFDTSKGTSFNSMFSNCINLTSVPHFDTSKSTSFSSMFNSCQALTSVPHFDTSKSTSFSYMFSNCINLTSVPHFDTSKSTSFSYMFSNCSKLETVSITTAKSNLSTNTFQNCTALKNLTIGEGWAVSIYLNYSNNLTVESLHGMIENLADLTGQTAKTFQIGATNLAKIDEEHINMLKAKNWNYS